MRDLVIKLLICGLFQLMKNQKAEEISASKIMRGFCFKGEIDKEMTKYLFHMTLRKVKNPFSMIGTSTRGPAHAFHSSSYISSPSKPTHQTKSIKHSKNTSKFQSPLGVLINTKFEKNREIQLGFTFARLPWILFVKRHPN